MPVKPPSIPPTIFETFPRVVRTKPAPTLSLVRPAQRSQIVTTSPILGPLLHQHQLQNFFPYHIRSMSTNPTSSEDGLKQYGVQTPASALNPSAGVDLSSQQTLLLTSVLDLFSGLPSKRKLTLWHDDASFHDPLTNSVGRRQFEAQWYGLKAAFSKIERLSCEVTSAGEPMELKLKTRYTVKGLGHQQEIDSLVVVATEDWRVKKLEDKWGGEIGEGPVKRALRALNAVTVPLLISVPKSVEEEEAGK